LPSGTFEHDLAIRAGYQAYSAELLRLALLAVAFVGWFVSEGRHPTGAVPWLLGLALAALAVAAATALTHRYLGTEATGTHLRYLRLLLRGRRRDRGEARHARRERARYFKICACLLRVSVCALAVGVILLALAFACTAIASPPA
jgi:hypothetical protein